MAEYERSTTSTSLDRLPAPIRAAVLARSEASQLTIADDAAAFLTQAPPSQAGSLRSAHGHRRHGHRASDGVGARRKDVLVATHGERRGTVVLATRLEDVEVGSPADRLAAEMGDDGVTVTGLPTGVDGTTAGGCFFVGLGPPGGVEARAALEDAVRRAKSEWSVSSPAAAAATRSSGAYGDGIVGVGI